MTRRLPISGSAGLALGNSWFWPEISGAFANKPLLLRIPNSAAKKQPIQLRIDLSADKQALDNRTVSDAYREHAPEIRRFIRGVLRDPNLVEDVLQSAFAKFLERGGDVAQHARRSWLFRVAYNEAMLVTRRKGVAQRANQKIGWTLTSQQESGSLDETIGAAVRAEQVIQIKNALQKLSPEQIKVVHLRIYEGLKFAEIAKKLDVPLGTVLSRMRNSLKKLKQVINE